MSVLPAALCSARRVLAVQPHYDDNDIGAGGTLAALADAGAELHYLTVTDDLVGVLDAALSDAEATALLRGEQQRAGEQIGVRSQHWLGYPDAGDYDAYALRMRIIEQVRRVKPDLLMTVDPELPEEAHPDHLCTGRAVKEAALLYSFPRLASSKEVDAAYFASEEPHTLQALALYFTLHPTELVDISATRERKHRAIDCYRAQFSDDAMAGLHVMLERKEREFADGQPYAFAEPIKLLHLGELHCHLDRLRV